MCVCVCLFVYMCVCLISMSSVRLSHSVANYPLTYRIYSSYLVFSHDVMCFSFHYLDVKPANLLISQDGCLKIGDFGLTVESGKQWDGREGDNGYVRTCVCIHCVCVCVCVCIYLRVYQRRFWRRWECPYA